MMREQKVIKGQGSLIKVEELVESAGASTVLLVTGSHYSNDKTILPGLLKPIQKIITPAGIIQAKDLPVVDEAGVVIALGGGRVMDFAKGIIDKNKLFKSLFIALPTTAGSGSEATPFAVMYDGYEKFSIEDPRLLPAVVILDPYLLQNLPPLQRAISAADAFAQAIESAWSKNSNPESILISLEAISLIRNIFLSFVRGKNMEIDMKMLEAAYLSGTAIAITRTTGPHALSYYLTSRFQIAHGQAVALFLPLFFLYNEGTPILKDIYYILGASDAEEAAAYCMSWFSKAGLATTFSECGLDNINIQELIRSVNHQRFANNPLPFDEEKLELLIRKYLV